MKYQIKDIEVGDYFGDSVTGVGFHVNEITANLIHYTMTPSNQKDYTRKEFFVNYIHLYGLVKKEESNPTGCSHRNVREDKWFTAKVFKSCKDCGAKL